MIVGIGTDLVEIERIEKSLERYGEKFAAKILAPGEMQDFHAAKFAPAFVAKRFAVKEAVAKALGTGMRAGVHFSAIEVIHDSHGKPGVTLHEAAQARAQALAISNWHVSVTDERQHAMAFVVAESLN